MVAAHLGEKIAGQVVNGAQSPESSEYEYHSEEHDLDNLREPYEDEWEHMREMRNQEAMKRYLVETPTATGVDM